MSTMNQSDIDILAKLLNNAIKRQDWDEVNEALEYIVDFADDRSYLEEE